MIVVVTTNSPKSSISLTLMALVFSKHRLSPCNNQSVNDVTDAGIECLYIRIRLAKRYFQLLSNIIILSNHRFPVPVP